MEFEAASSIGEEGPDLRNKIGGDLSFPQVPRELGRSDVVNATLNVWGGEWRLQPKFLGSHHLVVQGDGHMEHAYTWQ